jgi:hypothetical protein
MQTNLYEELSSAFPCCDLTLGVTLEASDPWQTLRVCANLFDKHDVSLLGIQHRGNRISFKLKCTNHSTIAALGRSFEGENSQYKIAWSVTIGKCYSC